MRGSVVKRGGPWACIYDEAPAGGKRRQRWRSGFKTKREAEQHLREQLAQLDTGTYVVPVRLTVDGFARDWLPAASRRLRPTTVERYSVALERQVLPALGAIRLQALAPARIVAFYAELEEDGLSPSSIRVAATVLRRMLRDAERWGHLQRSPANMVDSPARGRSRASAWTPGEVGRFLGAVRDDPLFPLWRLAAVTGARRGELLGATWQSLALEAGTWSIDQQLVATRGGPTLGPPKSSRSRRVIVIDAGTAEALELLRDVQLAERAYAGAAYFPDRDLVFANPLGAPLHPRWVTGRFAELRASTGAPPGSLDTLRHSAATAMLSAGVPVHVASARLGDSPSTVLGTYAHLLPQGDAQAAELVAAGLV